MKSKNIILKTTAVTLCLAMTAGSVFPVLAADADYTKDENVYVTLKDNGDVSKIYVVNEFTSKEGGQVTDYGNYSSVKNLSTEENLQTDGEKVTMDLPEGKFYYQGNMESTEIPWKISITYTLDGKEISAQDLAGKSGHLQIRINTSENENCKEGFFDNYLLQTTVVLNTELCKNIEASGATAGNVGSDRQLLYNIMAGQEKEINISADVTDFEMDGITFKGVPMSFDIDKDSLDTTELTDKTSEIQDAAKELDDGAADLKKGTEDALEGSQDLTDGTTSLLDGTGTLLEGSNTLNTGSNSLLEGAGQLNQGVGTYTLGAVSLANGIKKYIEGTGQLAKGARQLKTLEDLGDITKAVEKLQGAVSGDGQSLKSGAASLTEGLKELKNQVDALAASDLSGQISTLVKGLEGAQTSLNSLAEQTQTLAGVAEGSGQAITAAIAGYTAVLQNLQQQAAAANEQIAGSSAALASQVNSQVDGINGQIQNSAASANSQIDSAIATVNSTAAAGGITEETRASLVAQLEAAKINGGSLAVGYVTAPDLSGVSITMPAQDQNVQTQLAAVQQGAETLKQAAAGYVQAAAQIKDSAEKITVPAGLDQMISQLQTGINQAYEGSAALKSGIDQLGTGLDQLYAAVKDLPAAAKGIRTLIKGFDKLQKNDQALTSGANQIINGSGTLKGGASQVVSGAQQLSDGTKSAVSGVQTLKEGAQELEEGSSKLTDGLKDLDEGTGELKDGTQEFKEKTEDIDQQVDDAMDEILDKISGSNYEPVSYVSTENTKIGLVQFAIRTDDIK